jgi:uncharacterized cysteine cluster protein YcgN (CxxCxxCC family)
MLVGRIVDCLKSLPGWEDICMQCGQCCFEREIDETGQDFIDYECPCEFLDVETRLCTVYEQRFELCDRCNKVTPAMALFTDLLPQNCEYRRRFGK